MDPDASAGKSPTNIKLQGMIMSKRFLSPKTEQASSGISPSSLAAQSLLRTIQELRPTITARASEIEMSRRIPSDIVEALKRAGIFRMFVPRSYGGLELDLPAGLEILVELAKIDSSVGWNAMTSSNGSLFSPFLPKQTYEHIYQNGPDVIFACATQPVGIAEEAGAGERVVNGRWPFASGCQYADWIAGFCVSDSDGKSLLSEAGRPQIQAAWLPAHEWKIEDTWHAAGLRGTGSHHVVLKNKLVPSRIFPISNGAHHSCLDRSMRPCHSSFPCFMPPLHLAWRKPQSAISSTLPLADGGKCNRPCRCGIPRYSNSSSAAWSRI
jgi:hypothetical protein